MLYSQQVVPGELTLVTGIPGSGKSEWIDALMVNLVQLKGWTFGLCSMENKVSVVPLEFYIYKLLFLLEFFTDSLKL